MNRKSIKEKNRRKTFLKLLKGVKGKFSLIFECEGKVVVKRKNDSLYFITEYGKEKMGNITLKDFFGGELF